MKPIWFFIIEKKEHATSPHVREIASVFNDPSLYYRSAVKYENYIASYDVI